MAAHVGGVAGTKVASVVEVEAGAEVFASAAQYYNAYFVLEVEFAKVVEQLVCHHLVDGVKSIGAIEGQPVGTIFVFDE